jgi:hypothetical protein
LYPLEYGVVGTLQIGDLLPVGALARGVTGQKLQPVMGIGLHNHAIIPHAVPFAGAKGGDVHGRRLAPMVEVVGPQVVCAPSGGSQHEEELEQAH